MKCKRKKICKMFILTIIGISYNSVYAENFQNNIVTVKSSILNTPNVVNNKYEYSIIASEENPEGAQNEPTSFVIEFDNIEPDYKSNVSSTAQIDFNSVVYTEPGIYEYIVSEVGSENQDEYLINDQQFVIYVVVSNVDGNLQTTVESQYADINEDSKTDIIVFTHELNDENIIKTGVYTSIIPFIVLIAMASILIIFILKENRIRKNEENQ